MNRIRVKLDKSRYANMYEKSWQQSKPFVMNDRAALIHRPRVVCDHKLAGFAPHISIEYHCGNSAAGSDKFTFLDEPPKDRLLCHACEVRAVMAGLPSAEQITGRHVHTGKMRMVQTCCKQHNKGEG